MATADATGRRNHGLFIVEAWDSRREIKGEEELTRFECICLTIGWSLPSQPVDEGNSQRLAMKESRYVSTRRFGSFLAALSLASLFVVPLRDIGQTPSTNGIPGRLDFTFTPETRGLRDTQDTEASVLALAVQPDGKVLVGGRRGLIRLNPDGSADASFTPGTTAVSKLLALTDGRIVVGYEVAGMARLNADGSLDKSFKTPAWLQSASVLEVALGGEGQLLAGLSSLPASNAWPSTLIRLNPDGGIDSGFKAAVAEPVATFVLETDGEIILPGGTNQLVRLNPDGTPDPSFVFEPFPAFWHVQTIALAPDGRLLVATSNGSYWWGGGSVVSRFLPDGSLDATFAPDWQTWPAGSFTDGPIVRMLPQADGKVLLAGAFTIVQNQLRREFARLNADGMVDLEFAPWPEDQTHNMQVRALALSGADRVVVGGRFTSVDGITRYEVARIDLDPSASVGFNSTRFEASESAREAVITVQRAGDLRLPLRVDYRTLPGTAAAGQDFIAQAGTLQFAPGDLVRSFTVPILDNSRNDGNRTVLLELNSPLGGAAPDRTFHKSVLTIFDDEQGGSVDPSFKADVISPTTSALGSMLALQPDGKALVMAGNPPLMRLFPDGSVDPSFAPDPASASTIWFLVRPNGKILVSGLDVSVGHSAVFVCQLNEDGSKDLSFQPALYPVSQFGQAAMVLQTDGRLIAACGGQVHRLNLDGSQDRTFKGYGFRGWPTQVSVDGAGRILLAGWFDSSVGLVRLHPDGSKDASFKPAISSWVVYSFALHRDNKIVLFGKDAVPNAPGSIVRLLPDGSRDDTFQPDFRVDNLIQFVPLPSGQTLLGGLGGRVVPNGLDQRLDLARVSIDGSLDRSFIAGTNFVGQFGSGMISAIAVQPDGAVLALGQFISVNGLRRVALARFNGGGNSLQLASPRHSQGGRYDFDIMVRPGRVYAIEATTDLLHWSMVSTNFAARFDLPWEDSVTPGAPQRFYRARLVEP